MKVLVPEPLISTDKQALSFVIDWRGESVTCAVTRRCLEVFFWLPPNADDSRLVSVFRNEFARIEAVARRKLLARPTRHVHLTEGDFRWLIVQPLFLQTDLEISELVVI